MLHAQVQTYEEALDLNIKIIDEIRECAQMRERLRRERLDLWWISKDKQEQWRDGSIRFFDGLVDTCLIAARILDNSYPNLLCETWCEIEESWVVDSWEGR